jgi:hypothetical protein
MLLKRCANTCGWFLDVNFHQTCAVSKLIEGDLRLVKLEDFKMACHTQKAKVHPSEIRRYIEYSAKYGSQVSKKGEDFEIDDDAWDNLEC